jgi:glycosyltransferase involved in cell wall biosynthesis
MPPAKVTEATGIVIVEHFDPQMLTPGGIDSIISDLVKFSDSRTEFSIVGIATRPGVNIGQWTEIEFAGKAVRYLPVAVLDRSVNKGLKGKVPHSLRFALGLLAHRRQLPATVYHAHRVETGFLVLTLRLGPLIQFIHNDAAGLLGPASDSMWRKLSRIYRLLETAVVKKAFRIVIFNKTDSKRLQQRRSDLIVSRTWFDSEIFELARDTGPEEAAGDGLLKVCWVGRLDSQKDPILALEVVNALKHQGVKTELTIAGDGVLLPKVQSKIAELGLSGDVVILGRQSRLEVASLMSRSSALLMTSRYEGSPVVLLEAGASGLPVVATSESDPDGALISGSNGERVSSRRSEELALALRRAATYSPSVCRQMAEPRSGRPSVRTLLKQVEQ